MLCIEGWRVTCLISSKLIRQNTKPSAELHDLFVIVIETTNYNLAKSKFLLWTTVLKTKGVSKSCCFFFPPTFLDLSMFLERTLSLLSRPHIYSVSTVAKDNRYKDMKNMFLLSRGDEQSRVRNTDNNDNSINCFESCLYQYHRERQGGGIREGSVQITSGKTRRYMGTGKHSSVDRSKPGLYPYQNYWVTWHSC